METSNTLVDYNSQDWTYWKSQFLILQSKYEILNDRYMKIKNELNSEKEKRNLQKNQFRKLDDRFVSKSPSPTRKSFKSTHIASSSNEFDTNSSSGRSRENDRNRLLEALIIMRCDAEDFSILYTYSPSEILSSLNTEIFSYFVSQKDLPESIEITSLSMIYNTLYPYLTRDKNSFIFTLKGSGLPIEIKNFPNKNRDLLYGCCVLIQDILEKDKKMKTSNLCYCLLTHCPSFDLHFEVLYRIIEISRNERINSIMQPSHLFSEVKDLAEEVLFKNDSIEVQFILESYAGYSIQPLLSIKIDLSDLRVIEYDFPYDFFLTDVIWPCVLLFSLFSFDELMVCIFALLQESSVIVKSKNLAHISSCVLGLQALIKPLVWNYVVSPVLPEEIKEILWSDLPLLVGITYDVDINRENMIWADLSSEFKVDVLVIAPDFLRLYEKCAKDYESFNNNPCFVPSQSQEMACYRVVINILKYLEDLIKMIKADTKEIEDGCSENDRRFLAKFSRTQIFQNYIDNFENNSK